MQRKLIEDITLDGKRLEDAPKRNPRRRHRHQRLNRGASREQIPTDIPINIAAEWLFGPWRGHPSA